MEKRVSEYAEHVLSYLNRKITEEEFQTIATMDIATIVKEYNKGNVDVLNRPDVQIFMNSTITIRELIFYMKECQNLLAYKKDILDLIERQKSEFRYDPNTRFFKGDSYGYYSKVTYQQVLEAIEIRAGPEHTGQKGPRSIEAREKQDHERNRADQDTAPEFRKMSAQRQVFVCHAASFFLSRNLSHMIASSYRSTNGSIAAHNVTASPDGVSTARMIRAARKTFFLFSVRKEIFINPSLYRRYMTSGSSNSRPVKSSMTRQKDT